MRATSWLGTGEVQTSTKTHQVEPDGALWKSRHLTRGDLWGESPGGVSRGHSSEETLWKGRGAKGRRTKEQS